MALGEQSEDAQDGHLENPEEGTEGGENFSVGLNERDLIVTFFQRFQPELMRHAVRKLRSFQDAEDAIQEVAIIALRNFRQERGSNIHQVKNFLFTILNNVIIRIYRGAWSRRAIPTSSEEIQRLLTASPEEARLHARSQLRRLVPYLDDAELALLQAVADGVTAREFAGELDVPEGTVRSRLRLIRTRLNRDDSAEED